MQITQLLSDTLSNNEYNAYFNHIFFIYIILIRINTLKSQIIRRITPIHKRRRIVNHKKAERKQVQYAALIIHPIKKV